MTTTEFLSADGVPVSVEHEWSESYPGPGWAFGRVLVRGAPVDLDATEHAALRRAIERSLSYDESSLDYTAGGAP